eukprot:3245158-Heterocapsa_arctica.AAC.1
MPACGSDSCVDDAVEYMVLDVVEAFWNIPLAKAERRFFVGRHQGAYFVFLTAAQGSPNGPLAWSGVASLCMRLAQATFWESGRCPLRIN